MAHSHPKRSSPPGRKSVALPSRNWMTVDSSPTAQGPPSRTMSTAEPSDRFTWAAVVGLMRPDRLALGAAIGRSTSFSSASAMSCWGTRKAMLSNPAEANNDTGQSLRRSTTSVSGPGQNTRAKVSAAFGNIPSARAASRSATWEISGLNWGRDFAANIFATAASLVASPPSP